MASIPSSLFDLLLMSGHGKWDSVLISIIVFRGVPLITIPVMQLVSKIRDYVEVSRIKRLLRKMAVAQEKFEPIISNGGLCRPNEQPANNLSVETGLRIKKSQRNDPNNDWQRCCRKSY